MIQKIKQFIQQNNLFSTQDLIVLAVSGGRDSMVLLHVLKELGYSFIVAHCNFKLRQAESEEDQNFIEDYCLLLQLELHVKRFDTKKYARLNKLSVQLAARQLRYDWFEELRIQKKATKIVTAHHLDDQAESFFINLSRGTGVKGLLGIPVQTNSVVRPMLEITRKEIDSYVNENKILYREDSSNSSLKYLRNQFRHKVLPEFYKSNPSFDESFKITKSHIKDVSDYWSFQYKDWKSKFFINNCLKLSQDEVSSVNHKSFFSFLLKELGFERSDIQIVFEQDRIFSTGKKFLSKTHSLLFNRGCWEIRLADQTTQTIFLINDSNCPLSFEISLENKSTCDYKRNTNKQLAFIDYQKIKGKLSIRKWQKGDRFIPFGMKGSKKISDFYIDEKISLLDKAKIWLLCDEKNIIWLIGYRIDNRYRVEENTKEILKINCLE